MSLPLVVMCGVVYYVKGSRWRWGIGIGVGVVAVLVSAAVVAAD